MVSVLSVLHIRRYPALHCVTAPWLANIEVRRKVLPMTRPILYKCPQTGTNVQHWLADAPDDVKDAHSPVSCPACANIHFIHNSTGKLLGEK
jgi:hypothetical protein